MKVLATGGTGTLGRLFVSLAAASCDVRVLTRRHGAHSNQIRGDLVSGDNLDAATSGIDTIVHLASDPRRAAQVDVAGTRNLLAAAKRAGVRHFVYISIVGIDNIPYSYYQQKLSAERLIQAAGLPYSIVRATQFHSLVDTLLTTLGRVPLLLPLPGDFQFQSVDEGEVAARLLRCVSEPPLNRTANFGGPEVLRLGAMANAWRSARGFRKRIVQVRVPGGIARAFREGRNTAPLDGRGLVAWNQWLMNPSPKTPLF